MMFKKIIFMATLTAIPVLAAANTRPAATSQRVLFSQLAQQCGKDVHPDTLQAVARVESQFNPYAIGVVNGALPRQPRNMAEAVAAAKMLHAQGRNFSMGLMQVNRYNLAAYGLNYETVFQPCNNIRAGAAILSACFKRAGGNGQTDLQKAFSCYYSGNFKTGFRADFKGQPPYVVKILNAARVNHPQQMLAYSVPAINTSATPALPVKTSGKVMTHPQTIVIPKASRTVYTGSPTTVPRPVAQVPATSARPQTAARVQSVPAADNGNTPFTAHVVAAPEQPAEAPPERKREAWDAFGDF